MPRTETAVLEEFAEVTIKENQYCTLSPVLASYVV